MENLPGEVLSEIFFRLLAKQLAQMSRPFTACPSRSPHHELTDFIKLPVNLQSRQTYGNVIGSVNGLICFSYGTLRDSKFYIWNPSLSVVLTLPPSSFPSHDTDMVGIPPRFGFDPKSDDYKVVKITRDPQPGSTLFPSSRRLIIPYGFTLQNEFLFEIANYYDDDDDHCLGLYDPIATKTKSFEVGYGLSKVVEYVDSLVWVAPVEHEMSCCNISRLKI